MRCDFKEGEWQYTGALCSTCVLDKPLCSSGFASSSVMGLLGALTHPTAEGYRKTNSSQISDRFCFIF